MGLIGEFSRGFEANGPVWAIRRERCESSKRLRIESAKYDR
jgi:hypothetical protein